MIDVKKTDTNVKELSDDVLCALVARNEIRKLGYTPTSNPAEFANIFHEYADFTKNTNEKLEAKTERARRKKLVDYLVEHFGIAVVNGQLVGSITID